MKNGQKYNPEELISINNSDKLAETLRCIFDADSFEWTEEFILLCLNRANKLIGYYKVSRGGQHGTVADPKVIFTTALNCGACGIIVAHNHPSGNPKPSSQDIEITRKLEEAGQLLDIKLIDHLILTPASYYSFTDEGMIRH